MKSVGAAIAGLCLALAATAAPLSLRVISVNDFHGNLEPASLALPFFDPRNPAADGKPVNVPAGGAAALAGLMHELRKGPQHNLFIAAGDLIGASPLVSTLYRHETTIEFMNGLGLEADAVGNHEFDAGIGELKRIGHGGCAVNKPGDAVSSCVLGPYRGAKFPLLSSNILDAVGQPVLAPYTIKRYGNVRVGIIGAVTKTLPVLVSPSGIAGLSIIDEADGVNRAAKVLKAKGVKTLIAVFHEGGELGSSQQRGNWNDTRCPDAHGPIFDIARRLSADVGLILSAHTHQGYRCIVDGRVIIQATSFGRGIAIVDLKLDRRTRKIIPALTESINLPVLNVRTPADLRERVAATYRAPWANLLRTFRPDTAVAMRVAGFSAYVAPVADRPIGVLGAKFARGDGAEVSQEGMLIADAQLAAASPAEAGGARIAFMNPGGIRSDLECIGASPCVVTFGQAFTSQPFGNNLVMMTLNGTQLKALLESQSKPGGQIVLLQPSKGFTYTWRPSAPAGERAGGMALDGQPIDPAAFYRIAVNSFLAEGGDGFTTLLDGTDRSGGGSDIDALLAWLKGPALRSPTEPARVTIVP